MNQFDLKKVNLSPECVKFKQALLDSLEGFEGKLSAPEILAVVSQLLGTMMAMQTAMGPDLTMDMVNKNIQSSYKHVILRRALPAGNA